MESVIKRFLGRLTNNRTDLVIFFAVLVVSSLISCRNISGTGPLWSDASQYANAGAMIHDWLISGDLLRPYSFAKQNYAQYPSFHLPYHPPIYPGLLGLFFVMTGVSYVSARIFISFCLGIAGCFFYAILRERGMGKPASFAGAILLLTLPEIAFWSGDTMSEIPALALIISGSYFFLVWIRTNLLRYYVLAFTLAEAAFLSRYITAGILLAWFFWIVLTGNLRKLLSPVLIALPAFYLILNIAWIWFALGFSKYETGFGGTPPNTNYAEIFSLKLISYYAVNVPSMLGWPTLITAACALIYIMFRKQYKDAFFWLSWLLSCVLFLLVVGIFNERRYFIYALPTFPGLSAHFFHLIGVRRVGRYLILIILGLCLTSNVYEISNFPRGVVGYETVSRKLASLELPGNILVASWHQSDLIFRFRSNNPGSKRVFIRADRTLVIRPPDYTDAKPITIAQNSEDVLQIIQRGRIRYLVTCFPSDAHKDGRTGEMVLLHDLARSQPNSFALISTFPLLIEYVKPGDSEQVFLWKFLGELPQTPSELPVLVPTADMEIQSN